MAFSLRSDFCKNSKSTAFTTSYSSKERHLRALRSILRLPSIQHQALHRAVIRCGLNSHPECRERKAKPLSHSSAIQYHPYRVWSIYSHDFRSIPSYLHSAPISLSNPNLIIPPLHQGRKSARHLNRNSRINSPMKGCQKLEPGGFIFRLYGTFSSKISKIRKTGTLQASNEEASH